MTANAPLTCPECQHVQVDAAAGFCAKCRFPLMLIAGKYKMTRKLGEGGFGYVYLAEHVRLQQEAERVVKIIKQEVFRLDPTMQVRFEREVQMTSILSQKCQHIVRIYDDFGEVPALGNFYVMEYLQGQPVSAFIRDQQTLPPLNWCIHVFGQLCDAMRRAHEVDIVHRDLKPDNLMLIEYGDEPHFLKVLDFGIAKPTDDAGASQMNITQGVIGTPIYMAPELFGEEAQIDFRVDIYAMGIILYEMLAGRPPFTPAGNAQTSFFRLLSSHISDPPPSLREVRPDRQIPEALEAAVLKALEKDPADRYVSAMAFKEAVYNAIGHNVDGPSLSIPPLAAPNVRTSQTHSGEVLVEKSRPTPQFTPPHTGPFEATPAEPERREEVTNVRPSIWQPPANPQGPVLPTPAPSAPGIAPPSNTPARLPMPPTQLPPMHGQGHITSQANLPAAGFPGTGGHTPFPSLSPPMIAQQQHTPAQLPPSIGTANAMPAQASKPLSSPPAEEEPPKRGLLVGIAAAVGVVAVGAFVLFLMQGPTTTTNQDDGPSQIIVQQPTLPALPGSKRKSMSRRVRTLPIQPLNVKPLNVKPLPIGTSNARRTSRRRSRRTPKTICPAPIKNIRWHRIKVTPYATVRLHTNGPYKIRHSHIRGYRCIWFQHHIATLFVQRSGHKSCQVKIRRLTRHLKINLKPNSQAANIERPNYCRF